MSGNDWGTERRDAPEPMAASGGGTSGPDAPPNDPVGGHTPPPIPPPVWPGGAPDSVTAVTAARPRRRLLAGVGIVAAVGAGIGLKFVLPLVIGGVVGSAITGAFGGPWERLPSDVRDRFENRIETAAGTQLDGLSDAQVAAKIDSWLNGGYPRLDDVRLVRHLELAVQALNRTDEATCAAFGRSAIAGTPFADDADTKLVGALDQAATIEWVGLNVDAIEAELRGSPDPVVVSADRSDAVVNQLIDGLTDAEVATFAAVSGGQTVTDAETCGAIRSLYGGILVLDAADKAVMARIDVQP